MYVSFCFENGSNGKSKVFFMIFTIENLTMKMLIWSYLRFPLIKQIILQQLLGGLCNEFDRFLWEIKFFESVF